MCIYILYTTEIIYLPAACASPGISESQAFHGSLLFEMSEYALVLTGVWLVLFPVRMLSMGLQEPKKMCTIS